MQTETESPKVAEIKERIAAGTYETPQKVSVAVGRMIDRHTPGPWIEWARSSDGTRWFDVTPKGGIGSIAMAYSRDYDGIPTGEGRSNARLIAKAPELLAVLKAIVAEEDRLIATGEVVTNMAELIDNARPVIDRIEEEDPERFDGMS